MRVLKLIVCATLLAVAGVGFFSYSPDSYELLKERDEVERPFKIQELLIKQSEHFQLYVRDSLLAEAQKEEMDEEEFKRNFLKARLLYKEFEWAAEYFIGPLAERLNGPPDPEVENADLMDPSMIYVLNPTGLQVIEEFIFPELDKDDTEAFVEEVKELEENAGYLNSYFKDEPLVDWRILDAAKLGVFRIVTMGITGFDNPLTLYSMEESAAALKSMRKSLAYYNKESKKGKLVEYIDEAIAYLEENKDFNSFDRAEFITEHANKISTEIAGIAKNLSGEKIRYNRMLNQDAKTLFDTTAFNADAFVPESKYRSTSAKTKLGKKLFHEEQLSGDGSRNCFTCHKPALGFADGLPKNLKLHNEDEELPRNTPTLLNAALQANYFYDMRTLTLEDQALDVIQDKDEMDGDLEEITAFLNQDSTYKKLFREAFPSKAEEDEIQAFEMANALASYIRSLTKLNSAFDQYMRGQEDALTKDEVEGFNLFMGKAKCATCHFAPLFNGSVPPKYVETEAEIIGVPLSQTDSIIDTDKGWYEIIGADDYKFAFKTPSVRNVNETAPYMHNGIHETLDDVMEFYNNAGPIGLGFELENMTLPEDSLELSDNDIDKIISFMESLESNYDE